MAKVFLLPLFFLFSFLLAPQLVTADEWAGSASDALLKVEEVVNPIERLKEKITLFFKFSDKDKLSYQKYLVEKRLGELDLVIRRGEGDAVEEQSSRYATYVGRLGDLIASQKNVADKEQIKQMYREHLKILDTLQRNFEFGSGWWRLLENDINTVKIFIDKIN